MWVCVCVCVCVYTLSTKLLLMHAHASPAEGHGAMRKPLVKVYVLAAQRMPLFWPTELRICSEQRGLSKSR